MMDPLQRAELYASARKLVREPLATPPRMPLRLVRVGAHALPCGHLLLLPLFYVGHRDARSALASQRPKWKQPGELVDIGRERNPTFFIRRLHGRQFLAAEHGHIYLFGFFVMSAPLVFFLPVWHFDIL